MVYENNKRYAYTRWPGWEMYCDENNMPHYNTPYYNNGRFLEFYLNNWGDIYYKFVTAPYSIVQTVSSNTSNIATNASDISGLKTSVSTNTSNIAANAASITEVDQNLADVDQAAAGVFNGEGTNLIHDTNRGATGWTLALANGDAYTTNLSEQPVISGFSAFDAERASRGLNWYREDDASKVDASETMMFTTTLDKLENGKTYTFSCKFWSDVTFNASVYQYGDNTTRDTITNFVSDNDLKLSYTAGSGPMLY